MAEPEKQKMGDGSDNFGQAAGQMAKAVGRAGQEAAKQATANAATATVKAGVEGGKAVSGIAAGTAAGGPWGAVLSAAWSMRHSLFKVLICICLARYVKEVLKLTQAEIRSITQFERGEALVYSNNNKVPVVIKASKEEQEMITTDRAELEAILKERQKGKGVVGNG